MEVNDAAVLAELTEVCGRYQQALARRDAAALSSLFWHDALAVRFGLGENLYGFAAIDAFQRARPPGGIVREPTRTIITTYGRSFATSCVEDLRPDGKVGRTLQTWVRFDEGWRITAAHVSLI